MKILVVASGIDPASGGPTRSCKGLCRSLAQTGVDVTLLVLEGRHPFENPCGVKVLYAEGAPLSASALNLGLFELVHLQGLWHPGLHRIAKACRRAKVPYVISPRGMLDPWALSVKKWKKRLALWLYQRSDLKGAVAFHVTAEMERDHVRACGFTQPCIIAPNGVEVGGEGGGDRRRVDGSGSDCESTTEESDNSALRLRFSPPPHLSPPPSSSRTAIFLSRLHPGKGLIPLAEAWSRVKPQGWRMLVVGPDGYGHKAEVIKKLDELGIPRRDLSKEQALSTPTPSTYASSPWHFLGQVNDTEKWSLYCSAEILIHPSVSENFGITIAEALYAGLPVICTKGTPWSEVEKRHCGWWIDLPGEEKKIGVENRCTAEWTALDNALREATSTSTSNLNLLGQRGHALIQEKYTWSAVVTAMIHGYEQILNTCPEAPCDLCYNYGDICPIK